MLPSADNATNQPGASQRERVVPSACPTDLREAAARSRARSGSLHNERRELARRPRGLRLILAVRELVCCLFYTE